jgi:hypothetical protein
VESTFNQRLQRCTSGSCCTAICRAALRLHVSISAMCDACACDPVAHRVCGGRSVAAATVCGPHSALSPESGGLRIIRKEQEQESRVKSKSNDTTGHGRSRSRGNNQKLAQKQAAKKKTPKTPKKAAAVVFLAARPSRHMRVRAVRVRVAGRVLRGPGGGWCVLRGHPGPSVSPGSVLSPPPPRGIARPG